MNGQFFEKKKYFIGVLALHKTFLSSALLELLKGKK
jgi:hypothetical protein